MKATYPFPFDQIVHFRTLLEQKGVSPEKLQEHYNLGAIADVLEIPDPKKVTPEMRDAARRAYGLPPLTPSLLERLGTIKIPATKRFVAQERFIVGSDGRDRVSTYLGDNFKEWFLGKIEEPTREMTLRWSKLTRSAPDDEIRKEIGVEYEETTLASIWTLLWRQRNGGRGALLTDGCANVFYVRDINRALRAVLVYWYAGVGRWGVGANSVSGPFWWNVGNRAFSRNS